MKAKDIYTAACGFLFENPGEDKDGEKYYIGFLNVLLGEALPFENAVRAAEERELLEQAPTVESGDSEIPYCDAISRIALPYGLASWFFQDLADVYQAENYRNRYIGALNDARQHRFTAIEDAYPEGG